MNAATRVRPLRRDDGDLLVRAFEAMSDETRQRRFLAPMPRLSSRQLAYMTAVDGRDHVGLVALEDGAAVGIASYVRLHDRPDAAEVAFVVIDRCQGAGLGTELWRRLARLAAENGIRTATATVGADNRRLLRGMRRRGWLIAGYDGPTVDLSRPLEAAWRAPGRSRGCQSNGTQARSARGPRALALSPESETV